MKSHFVALGELTACLILGISLHSGPAECAETKEPRSEKKKRIKVFVLAGDANVLEQAPIDGATIGMNATYHANPKPVKSERKNHVNCAVYRHRWDFDTDVSLLTPVVTGIVEIGEQRSKRKFRKKKGRVGIPFTPFPKESYKEDRTTALHGYVSVPYTGRYLFHPGKDMSAFNVTHVDGKPVYRCWGSHASVRATSIQLERNKRYKFSTVFCYEPGHAFRVSLLNKPGTLRTVATEDKDYDFLLDRQARWTTRDDVVLYDMHPVHNNDKTIGRFLGVGDVSYGGQGVRNAIGPELTLGRTLGNHYDDPVLLLRFATREQKSLGHDYCPPSSGGAQDMDGSWDVIHFNWGIWDIGYKNPLSLRWNNSDKVNGKIAIPIDVYERNLCKLVARMKKTGATLIWASTTPVHPDCPGRFKEDAVRYNAVAAKIMKESGVMINDLHSESLRMGYPKAADVHSVGNLTPKVLKTIQSALANRKNKNAPLPRVLFIGDSISSPYSGKVARALKGKAYVRHNPGNGQHTGTGLAQIERWLDLKTYGQNGQEYVELKNAIQSSLADLARVYPKYAEQQADLAGLIWFQGIRDSSSKAMATRYEKHLANLIRDLRKDLNAPKLPVVVATIGSGGTAMNANEKAVFEAQMGIAATPEFKGNVVSIDTRKFFPAPAVSPGSSRTNYHSNAKSFLDIGNAMGKALIGLRIVNAGR